MSLCAPPPQQDQPGLAPAEAVSADLPENDPAETQVPRGPSPISDSASDVSMAAETDEEIETSNVAQQQYAGTSAESADIRSKKRKSPKRESADGDQDAALPSKKVKLDNNHGDSITSGIDARQDRSRLATEIWHHIFTFCPPRTLGNLLQVNKLFHSYLNPHSTMSCDYPTPLSTTITRVLKPNTIWQISRRLFWPQMPAPLQNKTELQMWQLACSLTCQHCGKVGPTATDPGDLLHPGPGPDGISIIWPFRTRSCGPCFIARTVKVGWH